MISKIEDNCTCVEVLNQCNRKLQSMVVGAVLYLSDTACARTQCCKCTQHVQLCRAIAAGILMCCKTAWLHSGAMSHRHLAWQTFSKVVVKLIDMSAALKFKPDDITMGTKHGCTLPDPC